MRTLDIALKDLYQLIKDWRTPLFLVIMPIFFTVFMGIAFQATYLESDPRLPVGVIVEEAVDDEPARLGASLIDLLDMSDAIRPVALEDGNLAQADKKVARADLAGVVVIPAGYTEDVLAGRDTAVQLRLDQGSQVAYLVQSQVQTAVTRLLGAAQTARLSVEAYEAQAQFAGEADRAAYFDEALSLAIEAWRTPPFSVVETGTGQQVSAEEPVVIAQNRLSFAQSSPGMIIQFGISGLIGAAALLVNERRSRSLARMLTTPTRRAEIIGGKLVAYFVVIVAQIAILAIFGQIVYGLPYFNRPAAMILITVALAFTLASMGLLIGAFAKNDQAVIILVLVPMFLLSALGGAWFPLDITSKGMQTAGHIIAPTAWAMDAFKNIIVRGQGIETVWLPAGIVALWGIVFFGLAVWRLRAAN